MFHNINAKDLAGLIILAMGYSITLYGVIVEPNGQIHSSVQEYNISMLAASLACFGIGTFGQKILSKFCSNPQEKEEQSTPPPKKRKPSPARKTKDATDNKPPKDTKDTKQDQS